MERYNPPISVSACIGSRSLGSSIFAFGSMSHYLFEFFDRGAHFFFVEIRADKRLRQVDAGKQFAHFDVVRRKLCRLARLRFRVNDVAVLEVQRAKRHAEINRFGVERNGFFISRDRARIIAGIFESLGFQVFFSCLSLLISF